MDLFEQGKTYAQQGQFEEALDAFVLALENDKENADIHFYLGLCYSSLEEFPYAKYHYDMALTLAPTHDKTRLVYDGLKNVTAEKPPEKRRTRQAAAKARRSQSKTPTAPEEKQQQNPLESPKINPKSTVSETQWEQAFPTDSMIKSDKEGIFFKIIFILIGIALVAAAVYFGLSLF